MKAVTIVLLSLLLQVYWVHQCHGKVIEIKAPVLYRQSTEVLEAHKKLETKQIETEIENETENETKKETDITSETLQRGMSMSSAESQLQSRSSQRLQKQQLDGSIRLKAMEVRLRGTGLLKQAAERRSAGLNDLALTTSNITTLEDLERNVDLIFQQIQETENDLAFAIDDMWVIVTGIGIFAMQLGFSMLESGTVESKSVKSVLMKNINDSLFGGIMWYLFGYGLFMGDNPFAAGDPGAFLPNEYRYYSNFFQQYGFSVTATTIVSGAIVGRIRFESYLMFSIMFTAYVYPLAGHWCWGSNGWIASFGFIDFAGSGIVHGLGGFAALAGAWLVGPRVGRFYPLAPGQKRPLVRSLKANSVVLLNLGGFLLYINWFFFNAGSSLGLSTYSAYVAASRATMNTLIASVFCAGTTVSYEILLTNTKEVEKIINSLLAGLVAITAGCGSVNPWSAMVIGILSSPVYLLTSYFLLHVLCIDDALDAFAIHAACGSFGVIAVGFFHPEQGVFYTGSTDLLWAQLLGMLVLALWGFFNSLFIFLGIASVTGLVVSKEEQAVGLDLVMHDAAMNELDATQVQEYALRKDLENRMIQKKKRERENQERKATAASGINTVVGKTKSKQATVRAKLFGGKKSKVTAK